MAQSSTLTHQPRASSLIWSLVALLWFQGLVGLISIDVLSSSRAAMQAESLWSKGQKDAVLSLHDYSLRHDPQDFARFQRGLAIPMAFGRARDALDRPQADYAGARRDLAEGGLADADIPGIIRLFAWLPRIPSLGRAVDAWRQADDMLRDIATKAEDAHQDVMTGATGTAAILGLEAAVDTINPLLTSTETEFSLQLSDASRSIQDWLLTLQVLLTAVLSYIAVHSARRSLGLQAQAQRFVLDSQKQLATIVDSAMDAILTIDADQRILVFNHAAETLFGCSQHQAIGQDCMAFLQGDRWLPDLVRSSIDLLASQLRENGAEGTWHHEMRLARCNGELFLAELALTRSAFAGRSLTTLLLRDITERSKAAEAIQRDAMQQRLLASFGGFVLTHNDMDDLARQTQEAVLKGLEPDCFRYLSVSDSEKLVMCTGTGWSQAWMPQLYDWQTEFPSSEVTDPTAVMLTHDLARGDQTRLSPVLREHGLRSAIEVAICGSQGRYGLLGAYSRRAHAFDQRSADYLATIAHTLASALDRQASILELSRRAQYDALTGLPNRVLFNERLAAAIRFAQSRQTGFGLMFVDVDHFKSINDHHGHEIGDGVLRETAKRLEQCVRSGDTVARLGGDEFAIILSEMARPDDSRRVANDILQRFAEAIHIAPAHIQTSVSIGISTYPQDGGTAEALLKCADLAMYRAKASGRNAFELSPAPHDNALPPYGSR
jgi:diguanylate cyclase (GGDEF)-like protein/PAS domain S-box-containing protein